MKWSLTSGTTSNMEIPTTSGDWCYPFYSVIDRLIIRRTTEGIIKEGSRCVRCSVSHFNSSEQSHAKNWWRRGATSNIDDCCRSAPTIRKARPVDFEMAAGTPSAQRAETIARKMNTQLQNSDRSHFPAQTNYKSMKLIKGILPLVLLIAICCSPEDSNIKTEIKIPVSVVSIKPQSISRFIETTGTVYSSKEGTVKSELSGVYKLQRNPATGRPFALGDAVKAGQILIRMEDREFENNLQIEGKKLNLELADNNLKKQQSLYDKGGVTQTELKNSAIQYVNAKYAYENAEIQLAKMSVKAPFDGVIVEIPYHTDGVKIDQGQALFKVMQYDKLLMDVKLPEKH